MVHWCEQDGSNCRSINTKHDNGACHRSYQAFVAVSHYKIQAGVRSYAKSPRKVGLPEFLDNALKIREELITKVET